MKPFNEFVDEMIVWALCTDLLEEEEEEEFEEEEQNKVPIRVEYIE